MKKYNPYDWLKAEIKPIPALKVDKSNISPMEHYKAAKRIKVFTPQDERRPRSKPPHLDEIRKML